VVCYLRKFVSKHVCPSSGVFPDWLVFAGWLVGSPVLWEGNGVEARVILVVLRWLYGTFWMLDNTMSSCYVHFRLLLFFF